MPSHLVKTSTALCLFVCSTLIAWADPTPSASPSLVKLQFPNEDVENIVGIYAALTQFEIIKGNSLHGKVSVFTTKPITREEAIEIIEKTLFADGFAILQVNPTTIEIVGPSGNPRGSGIPTISDPAQIPQQERLISFLFTFKHRGVQQMKEALTQYLDPPKPYTSFVVVPDANALWLTERTSVIRNLVGAMEKLDAKPMP